MYTETEVRNKIREIVENVTEVSLENIKDSDLLMDDIQLSSMEIMIMFAEVEKEFHIKVDENDIRGIYTIDDIVRYVMGKLEERDSGIN